MHPGRIKKKRTPKEFFQAIINAVKSPFQKEILTKAMERDSGIETEARNPDRLLEDKNKNLRFYDKMMTDDRIKMVIEMKKRIILSFRADFIAASDDTEDQELRDWVDGVFYSMAETGGANMPVRFWDVLDNLLDSMIYGFRCAELVWRIEDSKLVIKNIKFMHPIFFDFDYDKYANLNRVFIGREYGRETVVENEDIQRKLVLFVYPYLRDGNWYGDSDLKEIYTQYYAKYHIYRFRNMYLQNYGQPIPVVKFDKVKTDPAELETMKTMLKNFQENMYLLIPAVRDPKNGELHGKFDIDFRDGGTQKGTDQFEKAIEQLDKQITRKLLIPDKLGFSESDTGSYNLGQNQFDLLMKIVRDLHGRLEDTVNGLIKQMVDLNFEGIENYPEFKFESVDDKVTAETIKTLIEARVIDPEEKWIRSHVGAPELTDEEQKEIDEKRAKEPRPPAITRRPGRPIPPGQQEQMKALPRGYPVDFRKMEQILDRSAADFGREYNEIYAEQAENLVGQIQRKKIVENKDTKAMGALRIKKAGLKKALSIFYAKMYMLGKVSALEEIEDRIENVEKMKGTVEFQADDEWLDRDWLEKFLSEFGDLGKLSKDDLKFLRELRDRAFFITGVEEERVLKIAKSAIFEGIREGAPAKQVISKVESALREDRKQYATTIVRTNLSDAFNTGRMNTYTQDNVRPFIEAYQYQAIIDQNTTEFCRAHDGQIIRADDPQLAVITPPNHFNCRSILVAIMVGESDVVGSPFRNYETKYPVWGTGVPVADRKPAKGFGG